MPAISTGLHIVRKRVKSGDRWYVYAWRGGPCVHIQDGTRPAVTPALLDLAYGERRHQGPRDALDAIIDEYRASPQFAQLAPATQEDYRSWLNRISHRFGKVPARLIASDAMRFQILEWRDEMADTPRAADRGVGMLSTLLSWAWDRGKVAGNPAKGIKSLHKTNRADQIWEDRHWQAVASIPAHIHRVLTLASLTGLRQGDLLALTWEQVGTHDIETHAQKTGGRVVIPLHKDLKAALGRKGKQTGTILRSTKGEPWTVSGFKSSWQKAKPAGFDRRFHDLRGTFVTMLASKGFSDQELAYITGWGSDRIAAIRARYVDRARVAKGMARRLQKA